MQSQHSPQTVGQAGEFAVIAAAVAATDGGPDPRVVVDTGDDAAVLRAGDGTVTVCTDMLVEGRHFRLDWSAPADVGHKAIAQNAADIAAMGAVPTGFTVALACPAETDVRVAVEIQRGLAAGAAAAGARVVGGDLVQAGQIVVSVTALGDLQGRAPLTRAGARPGATVALAGRLGHGAAGLAALAAGHRGPETAAVRAAHLRPAPPYAAGPAAARAGAQALIDVSDGLLADLGHIARASSVRIDLDAAALARAAADPDLRAAAEALGDDPLDWVLTGGEDHGLVGAFDPQTRLPDGFTPIGRVRAAGPDGAHVTVGGTRRAEVGGWRAFDAAAE